MPNNKLAPQPQPSNYEIRQGPRRSLLVNFDADSPEFPRGTDQSHGDDSLGSESTWRKIEKDFKNFCDNWQEYIKDHCPNWDTNEVVFGTRNPSPCSDNPWYTFDATGSFIAWQDTFRGARWVDLGAVNGMLKKKSLFRSLARSVMTPTQMRLSARQLRAKKLKQELSCVSEDESQETSFTNPVSSMASVSPGLKVDDGSFTVSEPEQTEPFIERGGLPVSSILTDASGKEQQDRETLDTLPSNIIDNFIVSEPEVEQDVDEWMKVDKGRKRSRKQIPYKQRDPGKLHAPVRGTKSESMPSRKSSLNEEPMKECGRATQEGHSALSLDPESKKVRFKVATSFENHHSRADVDDSCELVAGSIYEVPEIESAQTQDEIVTFDPLRPTVKLPNINRGLAENPVAGRQIFDSMAKVGPMDSSGHPGILDHGTTFTTGVTPSAPNFISLANSYESQRSRWSTTVFKCALPTCQKYLDDAYSRTCCCPFCGPRCETRYCSQFHRLQDAEEHYYVCDTSTSLETASYGDPGCEVEIWPALYDCHGLQNSCRFVQIVFHTYSTNNDYVLRATTNEDLDLHLVWPAALGTGVDKNMFHKIFYAAFSDHQQFMLIGFLYLAIKDCLAITLASRMGRDSEERSLEHKKWNDILDLQFGKEFSWPPMGLRRSAEDAALLVWQHLPARTAKDLLHDESAIREVDTICEELRSNNSRLDQWISNMSGCGTIVDDTLS